MLTRNEILVILQRLALETVIERDQKKFNYIIMRQGSGYSDETDPITGVKIGQLQTKLSIMLEVATKREK